jgi:intermediate cleaving peptidase 55
MLLYSTGTDPPKEKWDGASTRFPDVVALFGADDARPRESFADDLRALAARAEHVYIDVPERHRRQQQQQRRGGGSAGAALLGYLSRRHNPEGPPYLDAVPAAKRKPLAPLVGALRSVKSPCEVDVMKASAEISARAHAKVSGQFCVGAGCKYFFLADGRAGEKTMRFAQPGLSEADLHAHFEYICARGGAQRPAYVPVVASG